MICNYQSWTSNQQGNLREGFQPVLICKFQCLSLMPFFISSSQLSLVTSVLPLLHPWEELFLIYPRTPTLSDIMEVLIIKLRPTMQIVCQFRAFVFPTLKRRHTRELRISRNSPAVTSKFSVDTKVEYQGKKNDTSQSCFLFPVRALFSQDLHEGV